MPPDRSGPRRHHAPRAKRHGRDQNVAEMLEAIAAVIAGAPHGHDPAEHMDEDPDRNTGNLSQDDGDEDQRGHDSRSQDRDHQARHSYPEHDDENDKDPEGNPQSSRGDGHHHLDRRHSGAKGKDKKGEDAADDEKKPPMSPEKKRLLIIGACIAAIFLVILIIVIWLYERQFEDTDDAFVDGYISQIAPQASGRVIQLLVEDNQQVEKGQLLVVIDPRDYDIRLATAQAQYSQNLAQLSLQRANLGQAKANVEIAAADLYQAERDLKRFRSVDPEAITQQQLDNAVAAERSDRAKLEANTQAVEASQAQIKATQASVDQAKVAIDNAKLQLSYTTITAPLAGKITRRTVDVGNVVSEGQPILAVVPNDLWVTANFKETQLNLMREGQKVRIKIDAFPDVTFWGHVDSFQKGTGSAFSSLPAENATGNYVKVVQRVPVKIVFDDADQRDKYPLSPGLSVDPRVTVR